MEDAVLILEKGFWFAAAAIGFAALFNVPRRVLWVVGLLGALGGITKTLLITQHQSVIVASLAGSILIGILSVIAAHGKHAPPLIFSIPAVIPMVPGAYMYRMMLGFINLTATLNSENYAQLLYDTLHNALNAVFILMALALGVSAPMLVTRKESVKNLKLKRN
ncbi:threonine/serine exporter [bacterium]|nr:MAG: threonine/serine exporter [bacterium]